MNKTRWLLLLTGILLAPSAVALNGHILPNVGALDQGMGGAGIATSLDAMGSNQNNVSSIAFVGRNRLDFGFMAALPEPSMTASTPQGAGQLNSDKPESYIPGVGIIYNFDKQWTVGFSAVGLSGFGVHYPENLPNAQGQFNPLTVPQAFGGFGELYSNYSLVQLTPSIAYKLTPDFSIGLGANLDFESLAIQPALFAPPGGTLTPSCVDNDPLTPCATYGYATKASTTNASGGGFTLGATYKIRPNLALGLVYKSPQWFSNLDWKTSYPDGTPVRLHTNIDFPMIIGGGMSYRPVEPLLLALDVKWINYSGTQGLSGQGFQASPQGPFVRGFGWRDIWVVALGGQYQATSNLALRLGYNYSENPISSQDTAFNVLSPVILSHHASVGVGYKLTPQIDINLAYMHAFQQQQSGPIISTGGPGMPPINQAIPGTRVTNSNAGHLFGLQIGVNY